MPAQKQSAQNRPLDKELWQYSTPQLHKLLLTSNSLPKEFGKTGDILVQQTAIALVKFCIEFSKSPSDVLSKGLSRNLLHDLSSRFGEALVAERLADAGFDKKCKDYSKTDMAFLESQQQAAASVYKKWSRPIIYNSASGQATGAQMKFYPHQGKLELLSAIFSPPRAETYVSSPSTAFYRPSGRQPNIVLRDSVPECPVWLEDVFRFAIGFGEVKERRELEEQLLHDPSIGNAIRASQFKEQYPYLLGMSIVAWLPFGKFAGAAGKAAKPLLAYAQREENFLIRSLIKGCVSGERPALVASRDISAAEVRAFIEMPTSRRLDYLNSHILKNKRLPEWAETYSGANSFLRTAVKQGARAATAHLPERIAKSTVKDFRSLAVKWGHRAEVKSVDKQLIQFGLLPEGAFGMKMHMMLPSLNMAEHYKMADAVLEKLLALQQKIGQQRMVFKYMGGSKSWRTSADQFGKDFTIYFADRQAFEAALPELMKMEEGLFRLGRTKKEVLSSQNNALLAGKSHNMSFETSFSDFLTGSIRRFDGEAPFSIGLENAKGIAEKLRLPDEFLANLIKKFEKGGRVEITDDFLRYGNSKNANLFMYEAYRAGMLR